MTDGVIGAVRVVAGFDLTYYEEALDRGLKGTRDFTTKAHQAVDRGMKGIGSSLRDMMQTSASSIPLLGDQVGALGGVFGAVAVGGLAAFAFGMAKARESMDWAATLTDQAAYIGVSTEALQEYRYMADEAGLSVEDMEAGLKTLNGTLGAMKTGIGDAKLKKVFDALGITKADLLPIKDASQLLPILADKISQLGSQAEQTQIANKLGIGALLPLLQQGSEGMGRMAEEARKLGLVISNETVGALDEAQRKAEKASQVIDAQLTVAFANLAPVITGVTQSLSDGIRMMMEYVARFQKVKSLSGSALDAERDRLTNKLNDPNAERNYNYEAFAARVNYLKNGGLLTGKLPNASGEEMRRRDEIRLTEILRKMSDAKWGETVVPPVTPPEFASQLDKPGAAKAAKKEIEDYVTLLERLKTADEKTAEQYIKDSATLKEALDKRKITISQYEEAMARLGNFEKADPYAKVSKDLPDIEPRMSPGIEILTNKYEELAETVGTDLAYAFGYAIAQGEDLGDAFEAQVRRMVAIWTTSGLMKLFGLKEGGGFTGGGFLGMFDLKSMGSSSILPGDGSQTSGWGGVKMPNLTGLLGSILKGLPGHAAGTMRAEGGLTWVGEEGAELVNMPRGSQVFPANVSAALMKGSGPVAQTLQFDLRGAVMTQDLLSQMNGMAQQAALTGAQGGAQLAQIQTARSRKRRL